MKIFFFSQIHPWALSSTSTIQLRELNPDGALRPIERLNAAHFCTHTHTLAHTLHKKTMLTGPAGERIRKQKPPAAIHKITICNLRLATRKTGKKIRRRLDGDRSVPNTRDN
uniref:(northern house mosquito) hypothetical protein n=1 Tax=Culex pipiens TaxID=7175 RepID=A0A8D8GS26_CULPI